MRSPIHIRRLIKLTPSKEGKCSNTEAGSLKSFTLVELLIVIAILAVLAAAVVLVLNPAELLAQARDSQRVSDLNSLKKAASLWIIDNSSDSEGADQTVYISIPDTSLTCANISGLPPLPALWSYHCVTAANLRNVNGTGWIPLNLGGNFGGSPLPFLPIDPVNTAASGMFYTYTPGGSFELTALMEANRHDASISDGGGAPGVYQVGTHIDLTPIVRDKGLVGYWKFDEGSGATSIDSTGKWGSATITEAVWSSSCQRGNCLVLDGINDNAAISAKSSNFSSIHGPVTVMAWFNPASTTGIHTIFSDSSPELQMYTSGTSAFGKAYSAFAMGSVAVGNWYFGAFTHDHPRGIIGTVIRTYLNGDPIGQGNWTWGSQNGYANEGYYFGGYVGDAQMFQGSIDEIRIYNRALSAEEIKVIYDATK